MTWAAHPAIRLTAKIGVNKSMSIPSVCVGRCGVEVDVGVELLLLLHVELNGAGHVVPLGVALGVAQVFGHLAEVGGAGVFGLVDAVAAAGDLFLAGEHGGDMHKGVIDGVDSFLRGLFVDGVEQAHDVLVGSAVEGAFEGADGSGDGGVDVGEGGGDDAGGEGGCVELVVGVEDEGDVEGPGGGLGGLMAGEHPDEVAGVGERRLGIRQAESPF